MVSFFPYQLQAHQSKVQEIEAHFQSIKDQLEQDRLLQVVCVFVYWCMCLIHVMHAVSKCETLYHIFSFDPAHENLQTEELRNMEVKYEDSKEDLASQQEEVERQLNNIAERKRQLQQQEAELKVDEEHLAQLRSANATEKEVLLKKQNLELRGTIEREKVMLESLKKYSTH